MSETQQKQQEGPFTILAFEGFKGGLNTDASRPGIKDDQASIMDGFMPIGESQLRTIPGVGVPIVAAPTGTSIEFFDFGNIGETPYCIFVPSDGSVWLVNPDNTSEVSRPAPPGTILNPVRSAVGLTQWGSQFIILVAQQPNGYFIMDGSQFYQAGGIGPFDPSQITDGGAAYTYTPNYLVYGGAGSGVALTPIITEGSITGLVITDPGSGYLPGDIVQVGFEGGGSDQTPVLEAVLAVGAVAYLTLVSGGTGYTNGTFSLNFSGGGGSGATGIFTVAGGVVTSLGLSSGGSGYSSAPNLSFAASSGGSGAVGIAALAPATVAGVNIIWPGTNLTGTPTLTVVGGGGSGAALVATVAAGAITEVSVTTGGTYTSVPAIEVEAGFNNAAAAILTVMPFGISGSACEIYESRVWVTSPYSTNPQGAGGTCLFSAPESYTDFSTADGGGSFTSNDSFLRVTFTQPRQTNGFLYFIADSSVNYVAGVSTSGNPPTTTFTNQNADPETGTPYAGTVDVLGSNIVFANAFGVHVSYGGRVSKVSEALDGIYNTVPNFGGFNLSAAKHILYGKRIWAVLIPVIDQVTGVQMNKLFCWDEKKWWSTNQDIELKYIQHQEIASVLTAYGTDGVLIYPLFTTPSIGFTKTAQSKLWARPGGYMSSKSTNRPWLIGQFYSVEEPDITMTADNEIGSSPVTFSPSPVLGTIYVSPPDSVGQVGALIGTTISTNAADFALISAAIDGVEVGYRG
jgi:hypothetical protein